MALRHLCGRRGSRPVGHDIFPRQSGGIGLRPDPSRPRFISATPLFFTTITEYLSKASAAGGIALISSLGNLGPAVAPSVTGYITATTGSPLYSTYLVVAAYLLSGLLLQIIVRPADPNEVLNEPAVETGLTS